MTHTKKDLLVYIKIPLLILLIGAFYWRDFLAFWQTILSTGWILFTCVISSLVFVFLFQRRNALKALFSISENHNGQGAGFVLLALVLYIVGSYAPYALWLHLCSLILFIIGYLTLIVDFRIPKMMFVPLVALLLVVPPIGIEALGPQNLLTLVVLYLGVDAIIVILAAYIVSALKWGKMKAEVFQKQDHTEKNETKGEYCPHCKSSVFKEEVFCFHCGRQRMPLKPKPFNLAFIKFLVLLLIVLALSIMYVPIFSLANQEASLMSYTPHGVEEQTIITTISGWRLESSERLTDYEREHMEDFAVIETYSSTGFSENKSHIQLEIGSKTLYMMNGWQLTGWQRRTQKDILLKENVLAKFVVFSRGNNSITVLYWTTQLMFRLGSAFSTRNVGVSIFSDFTEPVTESKVVEILAEFRRVATSIVNWWDFVSPWTLHFHTLNEIYVRFWDVSFAVVGVATFLVFTGWVRAKDEKADRLVENAFDIAEKEPKLLVAISKMKRKRFLGKELFDTYQRIAKSEADLKGFYERIRKFSLYGLIRKDYVLEKGELVMVWKKMFL